LADTFDTFAPGMAPKPRHTQKEYAQSYDVSLPTVKRAWPDKRIPWDNPEFMGEYFATKGAAKREELLAAYESRTHGEEPGLGVGNQAQTTAHPAPAGKSKAESDPLTMTLPDDFGEGVGLAREVETLKVACRAARVALVERERKKDFQGEAIALRRWLSLGAQLRQVAKDTPKALRESSETVDIAQTKATWTRAIAMFADTLHRLGGRLQSEYGDQMEDPHAFKREVDAMADEALSFVREAKIDADGK
jgi:hypothetical protein